jgi:hypothetical protein
LNFWGKDQKENDLAIVESGNGSFKPSIAATDEVTSGRQDLKSLNHQIAQSPNTLDVL